MYEQCISSANPGLLLILIDQSDTMSEIYGDETKAEFAARTANKLINATIVSCMSGEYVRNRWYVAVIGYGENATVLFLNKLSELAQNTNIVTTKRKISDGAGGFVEVEENMWVFVTPMSKGKIPMSAAIEEAYIGAKLFVEHYTDSCPPVVVNITDGKSIDSLFDSAVKKIKTLETTDGNLLLANVLISDSIKETYEFPNSEFSLWGNKLAELSSQAPDSYLGEIEYLGYDVKVDSKLFLCNSDNVELFIQMYHNSIGRFR